MLPPEFVGRTLERFLPRRWMGSLKRLYTKYHRWVTERINRRIMRQIVRNPPAKVMNGPFQGMVYVDSNGGGSWVSQLIGSYEMELHELIEDLIKKHYDTIINIGCAEGYYAIGFAVRLRQAVVHGFDLDTRALQRCAHLAELNQVKDHLRLHGKCTPSELNALISGRTLIVCDCEGAELDLLDPAKVPELAASDMLVELHDFIDPNISNTLESRFQSTHNISSIPSAERVADQFPVLAGLKNRDQQLALEEFRPGPMEWGWFASRFNENRKLKCSP